ncbi:hypothetical protein EGW08_013322 [Elysia chlorotica]|uniref:Uncharacterized protein n=1 Tax=Elysia chlorotica TaxID=188477 RepID=A0A3S1HGH7_ELYCH|nr:hypothetical protein EGW08_013322 [Elysia chlorotica]
MDISALPRHEDECHLVASISRNNAQEQPKFVQNVEPTRQKPYATRAFLNYGDEMDSALIVGDCGEMLKDKAVLLSGSGRLAFWKTDWLDVPHQSACSERDFTDGWKAMGTCGGKEIFVVVEEGVVYPGVVARLISTTIVLNGSGGRTLVSPSRDPKRSQQSSQSLSPLQKSSIRTWCRDPIGYLIWRSTRRLRARRHFR